MSPKLNDWQITYRLQEAADLRRRRKERWPRPRPSGWYNLPSALGSEADVPGSLYLFRLGERVLTVATGVVFAESVVPAWARLFSDDRQSTCYVGLKVRAVHPDVAALLTLAEKARPVSYFVLVAEVTAYDWRRNPPVLVDIVDVVRPLENT